MSTGRRHWSYSCSQLPVLYRNTYTVFSLITHSCYSWRWLVSGCPWTSPASAAANTSAQLTSDRRVQATTALIHDSGVCFCQDMYVTRTWPPNRKIITFYKHQPTEPDSCAGKASWCWCVPCRHHTGCFTNFFTRNFLVLMRPLQAPNRLFHKLLHT
jgi:hypothetical protein